MEFENDTPTTDEQRHLAEARQLNIEPLNPSVRPEEYSDDYTAAQHLRGPAVANAPNDVGQNTTPLQPASSLVSPTSTKRAPSLRSVRAGMIGAIIFLIAIIFVVVLYTPS